MEHLHGEVRGRREALVGREQRTVEVLRDDDVERVAGGHVVPECPCFGIKSLMLTRVMGSARSLSRASPALASGSLAWITDSRRKALIASA